MHFEALSLAVPLLILIWSAAAWDLWYGRIPNGLVVTGIVLGCVLQFSLAGPDSVLSAIAGLGVGLVILMPGYLAGTTGAGDVKLMAAIGTFLGPYNILLAGLLSIAVGGLVALGFMAFSVFSAESRAPWQRYGLMFKTLLTTGRPIYLAPLEGEVMGRKFPFAVSIAVGTSLFLIWRSPFLGMNG